MNLKQEDIHKFWLHYEKFLKTVPTTEQVNHISQNLSDLCKNDIIQAFKIFQQIELNAIRSLLNYTNEIKNLQKTINATLQNKNKVFLIGCGASGRLAMLIKRIYEELNPNTNKLVVCVAAAGDVSLIRSVEQFEDHAIFGEKQLIRQGYTPNDLVIGLSASGNSNFILGAIKYASQYGNLKPYLIFNNHISEILQQNPNHILKNTSKIKHLSLNVGAMALTGSTRLQATTAMQIVLLIAITNNNETEQQINDIYHTISSIAINDFVKITEEESVILKKNEYIMYQTNNNTLGLSILADTTERAPTFNLPPFENQNKNNFHPQEISPFYVSIKNQTTPDGVWQYLFGNMPTCLEWNDFTQTSLDYINGFNLSEKSNRATNKYLQKKQHISSWMIENNSLNIKINNYDFNYELPKSLIQQSLIFKFLLNSHSTIMMGRLGYFESNLMIYLKPSNFKLIDRAIRYTKLILNSKYNINLDYKYIANITFEEIAKLKPNESIILNVINKIIPTSINNNSDF